MEEGEKSEETKDWWGETGRFVVKLSCKRNGRSEEVWLPPANRDEAQSKVKSVARTNSGPPEKLEDTSLPQHFNVKVFVSALARNWLVAYSTERARTGTS